MILAINKCLEIVSEPSKITLDVIIMYPDHIGKQVGIQQSSIYNYLRARELKGYYTLFNDIALFMKAHPDVQYRYFVQPTQKPESEYDILSFNKARIESMITMGKQDAQKVVEMGPGVSFDIFRK